jgi:benzil reductase ((S)-benzoin forming)
MDNKYVIITGITGGIGTHLAKICMERTTGFRGCFFYRNQEKFNEFFNSKLSDGIDSYFYQMENVKKLMLKELLEKHSGLDSIILILNSFTIKPIKRVEEQELDEIVNNLNVNIIAQLNILIETLNVAKANQLRLRVIHIGSGAAYRAIEGWGLYSGAKSYMNIYLKTLKLEEDIDIVSYDPGVVDTNMQEVIRNQREHKYSFVKEFKEYHINGKLNSPDVIAKDIYERYVVDWKANNFEERYQQR